MCQQNYRFLAWLELAVSYKPLRSGLQLSTKLSCCQEDGGEVNVGAFVVAARGAPEVLKTAEHTFDDIATLVGTLAVAMGTLAGRIWRDDRFDPSRREFLTQAGGVVGPVGKNTCCADGPLQASYALRRGHGHRAPRRQ
jgi:hypothetical protein